MITADSDIFSHGQYVLTGRVGRLLLAKAEIGMGVSTTGESWEILPTRILTLEIYRGISPLK